MIRFELCCIFRKEPIKFRRTTAKDIKAFSRNQQLEYIAKICRHNAHALNKACNIVAIMTLRIFGSTTRYCP